MFERAFDNADLSATSGVTTLNEGDEFVTTVETGFERRVRQVLVAQPDTSKKPALLNPGPDMRISPSERTSVAA